MHRQQPNGNIVSLRVFPFVRVWFSSLVWFGSFLSCFGRRYLRRGGVWVFPVYCAKKHSAVSDDATLRGRDVIFFLKQAKIILRCRYAPGMPRPGVSK